MEEHPVEGTGEAFLVWSCKRVLPSEGVVAAGVERLLGGVVEGEAPGVLVAGGVNVLGMKEFL
jgi:hypothetical protein